MPPRMNRIVLAILALFAGLAAQVSPAEARVCGKVEIGASVGVKASARVVAVAAAMPFRSDPQPLFEAPRPAPEALPLPAWAAPTVRLGADRARE
jgi:hypothetical protein